MSYGQWLYTELCDVVNTKPAHFFKNVVDYNGHKVAIFSYALTTPDDFGYGQALETRGSAFIVDNEENFISLLALPFEKFFNLHELDYENAVLNEKFKERYGVFCTSETVNLLMDECIVMDKRDGSIITFFMLDGVLDCKSNSSMTSDYKYEALEVLKNNPELYQKIEGCCSKGYSVSTEYTSNNPMRQIVLTYDEERIVIHGVRSHEDGSYLSYAEMINTFGVDDVVATIDTQINDESFTKEDIEGYVVWHEHTNLRVKIKTDWYVTRHGARDAATVPSNVWKMFINDTVDDVTGLLAESSVLFLEEYLKKSRELYDGIVNDGIDYYENNKHLDRPEFFKKVVSNDPIDSHSCNLAKNLYNGVSMEKALDKLHEKFTERKTISRLGITKWTI